MDNGHGLQYFNWCQACRSILVHKDQYLNVLHNIGPGVRQCDQTIKASIAQVFTACVRSTREGTVFTGVCLFTSVGGGTYLPRSGWRGYLPSQVEGGRYPPSQVWLGGGYLPSQVWMEGVPTFPGLEGVPTFPGLAGGGTYLARQGVPPFEVWMGGDLPWMGEGYLPWMGGGYPLFTGYAAGGMPLHSCRRIFLFVLISTFTILEIISSRWQYKQYRICTDIGLFGRYTLRWQS